MTWSEVIELEMHRDELDRLRRLQASGTATPSLQREIAERTRRERELIELLGAVPSK